MGIPLPGPAKGLRIGLFGGSFDPAHEGHRFVAETGLRRLGLDWVWWIPARGNPLKRDQTPFETRFASALRLADHPRMRVWDIEHRLDLTYTADTLQDIRRLTGDAHLVWLMGADGLAEFDRWSRWQSIAHTVPIAVIARPGSRKAARRSTFARRFFRDRVPQSRARRLPFMAAPAWTYLTARLNPLSSTALRDTGSPNGEEDASPS